MALEAKASMSAEATQTSTELEEYCWNLHQAGLDAPWSRPGPLIESKKTRVEPRLWRWSEIAPLLRRSVEFMTPGRGAERRVLRLANPGVPERTSTHTISVALQYLLPGEVAPAHRHTPSAIRFMLHGEAAYTTIEGQKCVMRPGDLVLTPSMTWHDHGNEGPEPVIWLDGLDSPVVRYLETLLMEPYPEERQTSGDGPGRSIHFPWASASAALGDLADRGPSPFDDVIMEYLDPLSGRSVVAALGCYLQMIRPGVRTRAHRQTSSAVYYAVEGAGATVIDGVTYAWREGDFFAIPPLARHAHANEGAAPAILFSVQDTPLLTAVGLYREEE
jgi:gentisate 1,2-dioxygenase